MDSLFAAEERRREFIDDAKDIEVLRDFNTEIKNIIGKYEPMINTLKNSDIREKFRDSFSHCSGVHYSVGCQIHLFDTIIPPWDDRVKKIWEEL